MLRYPVSNNPSVPGKRLTLPETQLMTMHVARLPRLAVVPLGLLFTVVLPPAVPAKEPLLEHDVLPILTSHCMGCHGGLRQHGGLDLRTLPTILPGGESGAAIEAACRVAPMLRGLDIDSVEFVERGLDEGAVNAFDLEAGSVASV